MNDGLTCIVYKFTHDCCDAVNIGKTEHTYKCRIYQALGLSFRTLAALATSVQSDVRDHCLKHKNKINIDDCQKIDRR